MPARGDDDFGVTLDLEIIATVNCGATPGGKLYGNVAVFHAGCTHRDGCMPGYEMGGGATG